MRKHGNTPVCGTTGVGPAASKWNSVSDTCCQTKWRIHSVAVMCKTGRLGTPHGVRPSVWSASQEYLSSVCREMRQTCHGRTQARNRAGHRTSAHRSTAYKWHSAACGRFLARGPGSFGAHHAIPVPDELGSLSVERERLGLPFPPDLEEQLQGTATPLIQFNATNDRAVDASSPAIVHYSGRGIAQWRRHSGRLWTPLHPARGARGLYLRRHARPF